MDVLPPLAQNNKPFMGHQRSRKAVCSIRMPAKDKYHDAVINALEKDGWVITDDPFTIFLETRRLYVDLAAEKNDVGAILMEIKVFEDAKSQMNYLANAVGQVLLYKAALDWLKDTTELFLAIPDPIYVTLMTEALAAHFVSYTKTKMMVYDPVSEEIITWTN